MRKREVSGGLSNLSISHHGSRIISSVIPDVAARYLSVYKYVKLRGKSNSLHQGAVGFYHYSCGLSAS